MKHILLPTDFSDNAWSAAVYALKLYANEACTFYFLHATKMKASAMSNISNKLLKIMSENNMIELKELKEMAENSDANANHSFEIILSSEDLIRAVKSAVNTYNIDLIIMGTKGASKAKGVFFGSNTIHLLQNLKVCPILIVPDEFDFEIPKQIAFASDFNHFYGNDLKPILELTELFNSKIRVVHIKAEESLSDIQSYNLAMLKAYLEDYPHSFHWMPDYGKKEQAIKDFIEELQIHVLCMINYKHSFIENITKEPIIKKIGFQPSIPFLVIPDLS
ncbi:MAG: universal stress protein [Psychroserpens sp.]|nr:universal stress protein [Psychroserpens sp.]